MKDRERWRGEEMGRSGEKWEGGEGGDGRGRKEKDREKARGGEREKSE